ncbi:MAG: amidase [Hyphomicrobiales bacterium]|jgi:Asp-tRNA(Asn)/Glu-tRNA(Gln) amidotransferase A subunit family amidase|nr:amidase [Hyphomicrobiales bacterium]
MTKRVPVEPELTSGSVAWLSAQHQLNLFRSGSLSPVDVLTAQIARIERHGAALNALTYDHFDEALKAARESERRYRNGTARALEGITVAIKDEYAKAGWVVTAGSKLFEDDAKDNNHPVIDKLLQAGAVLHAQTTVPELYLLGVTWSDLWGVTRNPWNRECTPGGSSGGSAALVAAGMSTLAIGSDMGGSIRIPCALNGLYGSKPAYGRIASPDGSALVPHASPGPLARHLPDLALLQNIMMGPAAGCPAVLRPKLELPAEYRSEPRRLALSMDQGWARVEPAVRARAIEAAKTFERAGHVVEEVALPFETNDVKLRETIEAALFSTAIGGSLLQLKSKSERLTSYGRRFVELAGSLGPSDANKAAEETVRLYRIIEENVFDKGFDALITPTVATTTIQAEFDPTRDAVSIDGTPVDPYSGWFLTSIFSLLNWMPVINVPAGRAANGVPTGMQIVTPPYEDVRCFEIAGAYALATESLPFISALNLEA